jgi:hypothetical protein
MSTLVTTASVWNNDDSASKKRQPTMRKTIKMRSTDTVGDSDEYTLESDKYRNSMPSTIDEHQSNSATRNNRVSELLNKITSSDTATDNNKLGEFKPMTPPSLNVKKDMDDNTDVKTYIPPPPSYLKATIDSKTVSGQTGSTYGINNTRDSDYSNYQQSYVAPTQIVNQPYYAKMGLGSASNSGDNKLMEKINYMIHLLEEKQAEKTNNITEEFILYTFLGVFIIFIVDSFSKSGKYIR